MIQIAPVTKSKVVIDLTSVKRETLFINFPSIWDLVRINCGITSADERSKEEIKVAAVADFQVNAAGYLEQVLQKPVVIVNCDDGILEEIDKGIEFYLIHEAQLKEIYEGFKKYLDEE